MNHILVYVRKYLLCTYCICNECMAGVCMAMPRPHLFFCFITYGLFPKDLSGCWPCGASLAARPDAAESAPSKRVRRITAENPRWVPVPALWARCGHRDGPQPPQPAPSTPWGILWARPYAPGPRPDATTTQPPPEPVPRRASAYARTLVRWRGDLKPEAVLYRVPRGIENWSLTSLQQRLVKTGGRLVKHARYYWLLLAEGHLTRRRFGAMLGRIALLPVPTG